MKTLAELWSENGSVPIKVKNTSDEYAFISTILGSTYIGVQLTLMNSGGFIQGAPVYYNGVDSIWELA